MSSHDPPRYGLAVSASIVTAELLTLEKEFERLLSAGVDSLHLDLEDGRFVPMMNLGTRVIGAAVRWGKLPVDVHLMVEEPERAIALLEGLPLRTVAVHAESTRYPRRMLSMIREQGWQAGIAFNPASSLLDIGTLQPFLDNFLMLTTEPERGDAPFVEARLDVVRETVDVAQSLGASVTVDGGVNATNIELIANTRVDTVVVGRALFDSQKLEDTVAKFKKGSVHE